MNIPVCETGAKAEAEAKRARRAKICFIMVARDLFDLNSERMKKHPSRVFLDLGVGLTEPLVTCETFCSLTAAHRDLSPQLLVCVSVWLSIPAQYLCACFIKYSNKITLVSNYAVPGTGVGVLVPGARSTWYPLPGKLR